MIMKQREMSQKMLQGVADHILAINDVQIRFLQKFENFQPQNVVLDTKITFFDHFWIIFRTSFLPAKIEASTQNVQNLSKKIFFDFFRNLPTFFKQRIDPCHSCCPIGFLTIL